MELPAKNEKPNRGGAPVGNRNRTRSGKRAWAAVKRLPKSSGLIRVNLYAERDEIEAAVSFQHGEISLFHAALTQSAIRHSGRAQLLERWLRVEPDLTMPERLGILKEIGAATDSRDKCLRALGLDASRELSPLDALAAMPALDAPRGRSGPHSGNQHEGPTDETPEAMRTDVREDARNPTEDRPAALESGSPTGQAAGEVTDE